MENCRKTVELSNPEAILTLDGRKISEEELSMGIRMLREERLKAVKSQASPTSATFSI